MNEINITNNAYIGIISRHEYDEPRLIKALKTKAKYIGLMGSGRRIRSTFKTLEENRSLVFYSWKMAGLGSNGRQRMKLPD